jgi:acyl carrier protein
MTADRQHHGVLAELKALIAGLHYLPCRPEELADNEPLIAGPRIQLDSMGVLNLLLEIERHFGCDLATVTLSAEALSNLEGLSRVLEESLRNSVALKEGLCNG